MAVKLNSSELELALLKTVSAGAMNPMDATIKYSEHLAGSVKEGLISARSGRIVLQTFNRHCYEAAVGYLKI